MLYLSWDIGIKNLAYCLVRYEDNKIEIVDWEVINLFSEKVIKKRICIGYLKDGNKCQKNASYYHKDLYTCYCKVHSKKIDSDLLLDIKSITCAHILKNKKTKCLKKVVFKTDNEFIGYCKAHSKNYDNLEKKEKEKKAKNDLEEISERLVLELDKRSHLQEVDYIMIENQPAMKNPKMKSIQMIIYSYFLIRSRIDSNRYDRKLLFLLASNTLKVKLDSEEEKNNIIQKIQQKTNDKYKRHKELAKEYCSYFLEKNIDKDKTKWLELYQSHKKKDDLADTFLMNIYQIQL